MPTHTHTLTLSSDTQVTDAPFARQDIGGYPIRFRRQDGFGSLNDVCAAHGKKSWAFLQTAFAKDFAVKLSKKLGQNTAALCSTHTNGTYRGTWLHPVFLVEAARWCDIEFGIACNLMVLEMASRSGRRLDGGDVELRLDAASISPATPAISSKQLQSLLDDVASLKRGREIHRTGLEYLLRAHQAQGESSAAMLGDMERAEQNGHIALPAPAVNSAPLPGPCDQDADELKWTRSIIRERVLDYCRTCFGKADKMAGVIWNRLYDRFEQKTGVDPRKRNRYINRKKYKKGSHVGYIEALGLLPVLFDLSAELVG